MTPSRPRLLRALARLAGACYPPAGAVSRADARAFVDDALDDAWQERGWRGALRAGAVVLTDLARAWIGRSDLPVTSATRHPSARRPPMDRWLGDLRMAWRSLRRTPGFTSMAIGLLALGVGATTAVYAVVDGAMLRPFPYRDMDRLAIVNELGMNGQQMSVSWPNFVDWQQQNDLFDELGIYRSTPVTITGGGTPERLTGYLVSSGVFSAMGIQPVRGRVFNATDDGPRAERTAIISARLWAARFGGRPDIVGLAVSLNNQPFTIAGVMPASMRFPSRATDVWLPLGLFVDSFPPRGAHPGLTAVGRVTAGVTIDQARAGMNAMAQRLADQYPDTNHGSRVNLTPYYELIVSGIRPGLYMLLGAVALVLLLACSNLASLMLARAETRQRELAVRAALGASRWQIVRQLLHEGSLVAGVGGVLGVGLAFVGVRAFVATSPTTIPRIDLIGVDWRVVAFAAGASAATVLLFALWPAWRASRPRAAHALREARTGAGPGGAWIRRLLVATQIALATVLLVGAGLLLKSLTRLTNVELGFDPAGVVTMRVNLPETAYPSPDAWISFHEDLAARLGSAVGLQAVGLNTAIPLEGGGSEAPIIKDGDPMPTPDRPPAMSLFQATGGRYFEALGIPAIRGRVFTDRDDRSSAPVAVIDETAAARLFGDRDPIGKRIAFEFDGHGAKDQRPLWREVVGVVRHVKHYALVDEPPYVQVYAPFAQLPFWMRNRRPAMAVLARVSGDADAFVAYVRRHVAEIDPRLPVYSVQTLSSYVDGRTEQPRLTASIVAGFAIVALLLAATGVYGVLSFLVSQRTREIGVRLALGAPRSGILRDVITQGLVTSAAGLAAGLAAATASARLVRALLVGVSPTDAGIFAGVAALLLVVSAMASAVPARRASGADPLKALRMD